MRSRLLAMGLLAAAGILGLTGGAGAAITSEASHGGLPLRATLLPGNQVAAHRLRRGGFCTGDTESRPRRGLLGHRGSRPHLARDPGAHPPRRGGHERPRRRRFHGTRQRSQWLRERRPGADHGDSSRSRRLLRQRAYDDVSRGRGPRPARLARPAHQPNAPIANATSQNATYNHVRAPRWSSSWKRAAAISSSVESAR